MSVKEDDDVLLHKASASLIQDFLRLLKVILWRRDGSVHHLARTRDLEDAVKLIEPFQEEPQLLDPQLKNILPPLVDAYLQQLGSSPKSLRPGICSISFAICKLLYTLCKIRGEKVVVSFFNHDAPNLERILGAFEEGAAIDGPEGIARSWEERYVLLLWLWHLLLVPFDLDTISAGDVAAVNQDHDIVNLPRDVPAIARRLIPLCVRCMASATKERDSAAKLLVRLALRDDMQKYELLDLLVGHILQRLKSEATENSLSHETLGHLSFLCGLTGTARPAAIKSFLEQIFGVCRSASREETSMNLTTNAVARKMLIKIYRNTALLCLQDPFLFDTADPNDVLAEIIETLFDSVSDSDTPVRYAASKALSAITLKLDKSMSSDVVDAILGSLNEDVVHDDNGRPDTSLVNALRWHGLTLTLAQLLFRRAPSSDRLAGILNALTLSLEFSQRAATGVAMGTNTRDAACYGIWALSRRYTTKELSTVSLAELGRGSSVASASASIPTYLATQLLAAACLDPAGNIRRGSSAALQELIGRHPDIVPEGISLVQIADYSAVGLRKRAMVSVGLKAAALDSLYWDTLLSGLQEERGIFAADVSSRVYAAEAIGRLIALRDLSTALEVLRSLERKLHVKGKSILVEERHGLFYAIASTLSQCVKFLENSHREEDLRLVLEATGISEILALPDSDYVSAIRRPELTATATCQLIAAYADVLSLMQKFSHEKVQAQPVIDRLWHLLNLCLNRTEPEILSEITAAVRKLLNVSDDAQSIVTPWMATGMASSLASKRHGGHIIALGTAFGSFSANAQALRQGIVDVIATQCKEHPVIESRVLALQAMDLIVRALNAEHAAHLDNAAQTSQAHQVAEALISGMNDYTINERGDVGSLVRLEALQTLHTAFLGDLFQTDRKTSGLLIANAARLSLEKLDKVRTIARRCIVLLNWGPPPPESVSSAAWFAYWLDILRDNSRHHLHQSILEGYISSAGMGSEGVVQLSRSVLLDFLEGLPTASSDVTIFTLLQFADSLRSILRDNIRNERVVIALLEVLAFLLDMHALERLTESDFKWRSLLSLVQKSHYQSKNIPKVQLALDVYRGLAEIPLLRGDVSKKLQDMLRNPVAHIKRATEETIYLVKEDAR